MASSQDTFTIIKPDSSKAEMTNAMFDQFLSSYTGPFHRLPGAPQGMLGTLVQALDNLSLIFVDNEEVIEANKERRSIFFHHAAVLVEVADRPGYKENDEVQNAVGVLNFELQKALNLIENFDIEYVDPNDLPPFVEFHKKRPSEWTTKDFRHAAEYANEQMHTRRAEEDGIPGATKSEPRIFPNDTPASFRFTDYTKSTGGEPEKRPSAGDIADEGPQEGRGGKSRGKTDEDE